MVHVLVDATRRKVSRTKIYADDQKTIGKEDKVGLVEIRKCYWIVFC